MFLGICHFLTAAYLEIGHGGGHIGGFGDRSFPAGYRGRAPVRSLGEAPEAERFLQFKLNLVYVIQ